MRNVKLLRNGVLKNDFMRILIWIMQQNGQLVKKYWFWL